MGPSTVTAARVLGGQRDGKRGEENTLSFDKFPFTGQSRVSFFWGFVLIILRKSTKRESWCCRLAIKVS